MELWIIIDGWLTENKHLLPDPDNIKLKVYTHCSLAWIAYKESYIVMIHKDHVTIMPPTTEHFTIHVSEPTFWYKLLAAMDRCVNERR